MRKKEMIAMLLAGGQGSRLGVLTAKVAKPAVAFGGKYRIIDFPLSNCINSGIDTVGVLTQYQPLRLNAHIGIGIPWDLDRNYGGVTVLPPYERSGSSEWYSGTANAIYQNLDYMEQFDPDYVLILSGDHIYKMDYEVMLDYHKAHNADVTIAAMPVPMEEASRFGIVIADEDGRIQEFQEKPAEPKSNLASMGIYIFSWKALKEALETLKDEPGCDFGKHIKAKVLPRIRMVWDSIPMQLAKENKKFFFGQIKKGARSSEFEIAIQWLLDCGLVYKVNRVNEPHMPLKAYKNMNAYKLFVLDVGLLGAMSELPAESILEGNDIFVEFKGALTEQYVLQQLISDTPYTPYYYGNEKATFEQDFLIQKAKSIVPIEVKAEQNIRSHSLKTYCEKFQPEEAVRFSTLKYKEQEWMVNIPLYAVCNL